MRFVGLLLVTKILPAGDADVIKEVFDAVGFTFLSRLVLPLLAGKTNNPLVADPEALQKAAATARLGLAVLSSFARVPELAAAEEMVEKLPLFLKVARAGGVLPILHEAVPVAPAAPSAPLAEQHPPQPNERLQSASQQPAAAAVGVQAEEPQAEAASVVDALECALCVAQSGAEGRHVALESGALGTALVVLQRALASTQQPAEHVPQQQQQQQQQAVRECLLVVRLLSVVLAGPEGAAGILGSVELVVEVVPHLVGLLALPAFLHAANGKPAVTAQPAASANTAAGPAGDVAALQLEALHVLHLLLVHASMDGDCPALSAALADSAARAAQQAQHAGRGWPADIRLGLELVLRSRVSPVERHAALQIAAAISDLARPDWLVGEAGSRAAAPGPTASRPGVRSSSSSSGSKGSIYSSGSFFQLVVEMTKIETSVLLLDALAPDARVPLGDWAPALAPAALGRGAPGSDAGSEEGTEEDIEEADMAEVQQPQHSEHGGSEVLSDMEIEGSAAAGSPAAATSRSSKAAQAAGGSSADVGVLQRVLESDAEREKLEERMRQGGAAAGGREAARPEVPGSLAQRVDEMELPTRNVAAGATGPTELAGERAARLLPSCFALLEACIEALASSMEREEELEEGGTREGSPPAPQQSLAVPLLPPGVALRALSSLQEVCEGLLQFLEQTVGQQQQAQQPDRREGETPESLGAVQGALAAAAVRVIGRFCAEVPEAFGPRLRQLLPRLLATPPGAGTGDGADLLPFLLPLLVQVVGPGAAVGEQEQAAWLAVLRSSEVLPYLASFVKGAASDILEKYPPGSLGQLLDAVLAMPQSP
ncbi:hypothetical protein N2152v2_004419 [Parachlorella kessleri]